MKLLHTADWHMNDSLGRVDRTEDIFGAISQIAAYLEEYKVDVLIVAGDLFSERSRPDQTRAAISRLRDEFTPFLQRGGAIVAISGNHDSEIFFETLRDALDLVAPGKPATGDSHAVGRLWIAPNARTIKLSDAAGTSVQFVLMPYPTARGYLKGVGQTYSTIEEKHRAVQSHFSGTLEHLRGRIDPKLPAVLVSHIHIRGAQTHTLYKVTEVEDVIFEPGDIPSGWAYCAFGHIHKAQAPLLGAEHIRYCGSIERLDYAEREDAKGVILLEIGPHGRVGDIQTLPIKASTIAKIEIREPQKMLPQLKQMYPNHASDLVNYSLHWEPGRDNRDAICRELSEIFPRWYAREFVEIGRGEFGALSNIGGIDLRDVTKTVRDYLQLQLTGQTSRDEVLALAESLLAERDSESNALIVATTPQSTLMPEDAPKADISTSQNADQSTLTLAFDDEVESDESGIAQEVAA